MPSSPLASTFEPPSTMLAAIGRTGKREGLCKAATTTRRHRCHLSAVSNQSSRDDGPRRVLLLPWCSGSIVESAQAPKMPPAQGRPAKHSLLLLAAGFVMGLVVARVFPSRWGTQPALHGARGGGVPPPRMPARPRPPAAPLCPADMVTCTPPSVPDQPSQASYKRLLKSPQAALKNESLLAEFEAAPWLLPPRTKALPYAFVHDFEELLAMREAAVGNYAKTITLLLFSRDWAVMAQNSIYSLVKHAGVRNYVALTWTSKDLEACADLNLPCADVSGLLREPVSADAPSGRDFLIMSWAKPAVTLRALELGYAVMVADTDIAYTVKPLWRSYLAFIEEAEADGAWLEERPASNTGHFVVLPTDGGLAFAKAWHESAPHHIKKTQLTDQRALPWLEGHSFVRCNTLCRCYSASYNLTREDRRDRVALFRLYMPAHYVYSRNWCTVGSPQWMPRIDPCDWHVLYVHTVCIVTPDVKERVLQAAGFWFLDSAGGCQPHPDAASGVPACRPMRWRDPKAEQGHYSCPAYHLGLVHGGPPSALEAVRTGAHLWSELAAHKLFDVEEHGKRC